MDGRRGAGAERAEVERPPRKLLLRPSEAAELCSMSRARMYQLIASGEIPCVRFEGRMIRVPLAALEELAASPVQAK
jgi:excisionase family DNA binding protein